jgi:hypothetical protein
MRTSDRPYDVTPYGRSALWETGRRVTDAGCLGLERSCGAVGDLEFGEDLGDLHLRLDVGSQVL